MKGEPAERIRVPLSLVQEQMWQFEQRATVAGALNEVVRQRFSEVLDEAVVARAVDWLARRHETLRTCFPLDDGRPYQSIAPTIEIPVQVVDLGHLPLAERRVKLRRQLEAERYAPFTLDQLPLTRVHLFQLGDDGAEIVLTLDHLICDATSSSILACEVAEAYEAIAAGRAPSPPPLDIQYADFAVWERQWLTEGRLSDELEYWREQLAGLPAGIALPYDRVPDERTGDVDCLDIRFSPEIVLALDEAARATRSTLYVLTVAAVAATIAERTGQTDLLFMTTFGGRHRPELEPIVGLFAGVGVLRVDLSGDPTLAEIVDRCRTAVVGLLDHQHIPLTRVWAAVASDVRERDPAARPPVIPLDLQFFHASRDQLAPGSSIVASPPAREGPCEEDELEPSNRLAFRFLADDESMWGRVRYLSDFFDRSTVEGLVAEVKEVLALLASDSGRRLSALGGSVQT